jgi:hypothetical protein
LAPSVTFSDVYVLLPPVALSVGAVVALDTKNTTSVSPALIALNTVTDAAL